MKCLICKDEVNSSKMNAGLVVGNPDPKDWKNWRKGFVFCNKEDAEHLELAAYVTSVLTEKAKGKQ